MSTALADVVMPRLDGALCLDQRGLYDTAIHNPSAFTPSPSTPCR